MKPFAARCIQYVTIALMFILCYCGAFSGPNYVLMSIGIAIGMAGVVIWIIFGKCPKCGEHFGRKLYEYCPHCGEKIE